MQTLFDLATAKLAASEGIDRASDAQAARLAVWRLPFDPKLFVCHKCDNRRCVRPDHLFLGTIQDNVADMMRKGRNRPGRLLGDASSNHKLTSDTVKNIRTAYSQKQFTQVELARRFGVARSTISAAVTGQTGKGRVLHVEWRAGNQV